MNQGVVGSQGVSAEINDWMAGRAELCYQFLLQPKPAVIRGNSYAHTITFFLAQFDA